MSRRIKRTTSPGDRAKSARPNRDFRKAERPTGRSAGKPARFSDKRDEHWQDRQNAPRPPVAAPAKIKSELPLPTKVQTVVVTSDEDNMRVDRFLEARFPGLS